MGKNIVVRCISYKEEDIFEINALYAIAIVERHLFNDGNKRNLLSY